MIRIVFDLDGTLIDSVRDLAVSASELATSLGGRSLEQTEVASMVGDGASILVRRALTAAGVDPETPSALDRFLRIYDRRLLDTTTAYPGVAETLALLSRRAHMAVLTNKPMAPASRILAALELAAHFDAVIGGDGPHGRKPDPQGLRSFANGSSPLLFVGDSPVDWETAMAAGCSFAWARYGFGAARFEDEAPATPYVLDRPADLIAVVDRIERVTRGA